MIAIAESGSTKCDWVIIDEHGETVKTARTVGFNPYFHDGEFVVNTLRENQDLQELRHRLKQVSFFGAGCSSPGLKRIIASGLSSFFSEAQVNVDHDLVAAAYALYEGEPVIAAIIGTGSNSCFFDGKEVSELVPALGFILGDEASGSYYGKKLVADYFYNRLPGELHRDFKERYNLTWDETLTQVYNNIHANVYLASFMKFIVEHKSNAYVQEMVREGMARFVDVHVASIPLYHKYTAGFVGSIAYLFSDILSEELGKRDCELGRIVRNPIDNLVAYHVNYLNVGAPISKLN